MIVVADTTPLISLMKIGKLDILEQLFQVIQIPVAVFDELVCAKRFQDEAEIIRRCNYIHVGSVNDSQAVERLRKERELDLGEKNQRNFQEINLDPYLENGYGFDLLIQ